MRWVRSGHELEEGRWKKEAEVKKKGERRTTERGRQKGEGSSPPFSHST